MQDIKNLLERGVEEAIEKEHLALRLAQDKKRLRVKLGIDPTASDLHLGTAVALRKLKEFQDAGHKVIFVIGDFTARIGDPSEKSKTRPMLSDVDIKKNAKTYFQQVGKILDIKKAEIRYNSEWFKKFGLAEIINLASKFTAQQILERDDFLYRLNRCWICPNDNIKHIIDPQVKDLNRFPAKCRKCGWMSDTPLDAGAKIVRESAIGLHELFYPMMQAYDSVMLKADVEIGGTDQRFNMLAGRDLQRHLGLPEQDVVMLPLLVGLDGVKKMSKSLGNYIGITEAPNVMFGKIMSVPDELIDQYYELCTDKKRTISDPREAKLELGKIIVGTYHNAKAAGEAKEEFIRVFSKHQAPSEISNYKLRITSLSLINLLLETKMAASRGEAKRLIEQGGVKINNEKQTDPNKIVKIEQGVLLQVGKTRFLKLI